MARAFKTYAEADWSPVDSNYAMGQRLVIFTNRCMEKVREHLAEKGYEHYCMKSEEALMDDIHCNRHKCYILDIIEYSSTVAMALKLMGYKTIHIQLERNLIEEVTFSGEKEMTTKALLIAQIDYDIKGYNDLINNYLTSNHDDSVIAELYRTKTAMKRIYKDNCKAIDELAYRKHLRAVK